MWAADAILKKRLKTEIHDLKKGTKVTITKAPDNLHGYSYAVWADGIYAVDKSYIDIDSIQPYKGLGEK